MFTFKPEDQAKLDRIRGRTLEEQLGRVNGAELMVLISYIELLEKKINEQSRNP